MKIIRTLWYLCGLMVVAIMALSAMTVVPAAEHERNVGCIVGLALAALLAAAAMRLRTRLNRNPADAFLTSKGWTRAIVAAAIALTLVVLLGVIG